MAVYGMIFAGVAILIWMLTSYNRLVVIRQNVRESWSAIETELRRRFDLIPNLVETVKGYAGHERETLEAVIKARNAAASSAGAPPADQAAAQGVLSGALTRLMALSEAYPDLKANENFSRLQTELGDTETRISQARRFYNANVKELNTAIETFPTVLIAAPMGFRGQPYYGLEDQAAMEPVHVSFGNASAPSLSGGQTLKLPESSRVDQTDKLP